MLSRFAIGILVTVSLSGQQLDLPEFASIPAGEFEMGSAAGAAWERPPHAVETPGFEITARPVSNREYQAFRPEHRSPGDENPDAPVTGVTWSDADAYCRWLQERLGAGVSLPSEARWERAARGGLERQTYPWGSEYAPTGPSSPAPALRPNGFGVYAVAYNLWEWTSDWYAPDYFSKSPREDPAGPSSGDFRVLRGGGFRSDPASATVYSRGSARPSTSSPYVTFRVMKTGDNPAQQLTRAPAAPALTRPTDVAAAPPPPPPASGLSVTALAFEQVRGEMQIRLATTGKPAYRAFAMESPDRLVVDLQGVVQRISKGSGSVLVEQGGVKQIRYSQFQLDPPVTRAVIDLDRPLKHQVEASDKQVLIRLSPAN